MEKEKTAVEWLIEQMIKCEILPKSIHPDNVLFHKAKEMEKDQAKRMYSEEDVDELVNNLIDKFLNYNGSSVDNEKLKWFYQQFKKK